ncbi:MAG: S8 family serine peptidase [Bacteroidota bacterium]
MKSVFRLLSLLIFVTSHAYGQHVFWVTFTSKDSSFSINNPQQFLSDKAIARRQKFSIPVVENDLPLNVEFINTLQQKKYTIISKSKWQNGVAVKTEHKADGDTLKQLSFVKHVQYLGAHKPIRTSRQQQVNINEMITALDAKFEPKGQQKTDSTIYGKAWNQVSMLNTQRLHKQGFDGSNVLIAVLDAGFNNVDKLPVFSKMVNENRIVTTHDFVQNESSVFEDDDHGMAVLSCMAGNLKGEFIGTAPQASYALLRSEYGVTEMPIEEVFWAEAIEYADSMGADIVNSSLGYNEFDDSYFNYSYKDLNGKETIISAAASLAVSKGMVVVVSAGNEGDEDWRFICVPADVEEVITVGGVTREGYYAGFSSIGPTADKRIKPDVMAQGDNVWVASSRGVFYEGDGTSYSCPLLTGSIACLMQAHPDKNPAEITSALHLSGNQYYKPDKYKGYGIPDMELANLILGNSSYQYTTLLDARLLGDKRIHLTIYVSHATRVSIEVRNELNEIVLMEVVGFKAKSLNRTALKKIKKLKKGIYSLQLTTRDQTIFDKIIVH